MDAKRKAADAAEGDTSFVGITPLGAGSEVGRSCIVVSYEGKRVMMDCGIHPSFTGIASLPSLTEVALNTIDVALITHFHLDHCAAVPYLVSKTNFKGRIFMTHPTRAIYHSLLKDFVRVGKNSDDEQLYDEAGLEASMERIEVIDFQQTINVDGIKITPYRAGHVLGAAMFMIEIAGMRCLYTGDYSRVADRHLPAADMPITRPDIVICESTYGVSNHLPVEQREQQFIEKVVSTVMRGGRVLLPVVALGRAQELLLLMDEHWEKHPELHGVPIFQASGLMRKSLSVYQTYLQVMNDDIKKVFISRDPFKFRHVEHVKGGTRQFEGTGPCVLMATPSMLQSGVSRDMFEQWADDAHNAIVLCDFAVQGTMARLIKDGPTHVEGKNGQKIPLRAAVHSISFSAHADYQQTAGFLDELLPPNVVLVHGEATEMGRLKVALERNAANAGRVRVVHTPKNLQEVQIAHQPVRRVKVMGRLAEAPLAAGDHLRGVLVRRAGTDGATDVLLHPDDLPTYTKLYKGRVTQRQAIAMPLPFCDVRLALEVMFEGVEGTGYLPVAGIAPSTSAPDAASATAALAAMGGGGGASTSGRDATDRLEEARALTVGGVVTVTHHCAADGRDAHVMVEWEGGPAGDIIADAVVAVLLQTAGEPAAASAADVARRDALRDGDPVKALAAQLQLVAALMRSHFGPASVDEDSKLITLQVDNVELAVDGCTYEVYCESDALRERVEKALGRLAEASRPVQLLNLDA